MTVTPSISIGTNNYRLEWNAESAPENCWVYRLVAPDHTLIPYAPVQGRLLGKTTGPPPSTNQQAAAAPSLSTNAVWPGSAGLLRSARPGVSLSPSPSSSLASPVDAKPAATTILSRSASSSASLASSQAVPPRRSAVSPPLPTTAKGVLKQLQKAGAAAASRKRSQPLKESTIEPTSLQPAAPSSSFSQPSSESGDAMGTAASNQVSGADANVSRKRVKLTSLQSASGPVAIANLILKESKFFFSRDSSDDAASTSAQPQLPVLRSREDLLALAADTNRLNNIYDILRNWLQRQAKIIQEAESRMETIASELSSSVAQRTSAAAASSSSRALDPNAVKELLLNAVANELNLRSEPIAEAHAACKLLFKEIQCRGELMQQYLSGQASRGTSSSSSSASME